MKILLSGYTGHMGIEVRQSAARTPDCEIVCGVDPLCGEDEEGCVRTFSEFDGEADVIIDFSHHSLTGALLDYAEGKKLPVVLATTGQTSEELARIREAAGRVPILMAANYSLGIATLKDLVKRALALYPDAEVEIVEAHHDRKIDAPSGTALALFEAVKAVRPEAEAVNGRSGNRKRTPEEVGIHAIRMGNIVGVHEVIIGTQNETITLKHQAWSRGVFADGSLKAAAFLIGKKPGLYRMEDLLKEDG